jgi:hypothetical protein
MNRHLEENMSNQKFLNECITDTELVFAFCEIQNLTQKKIVVSSHEAKFTVIATLKLTFL